ncbi:MULTISPECIES: DUF3574 domain-containing protein [Paenibacillus]|uniref:DUF3574 domain-containing protein n=1 Tax=Paenibacillus campinasensis TaxID=66347 RepID=A0A268EU09_9BACL|nr:MULTISPECIES: DUF3574 domain-containing protein [Paenibacillus]MUG67420.1 DUF3574 domain-containing protein [Paenibacillus campinasensis]PAD76600.1 DUF3574 domain-containing protein [Paenibacillus campinasensis]PAK55640.1 DUF3574 domain-containing protein [Paenibacillus sp. 7541]
MKKRIWALALACGVLLTLLVLPVQQSYSAEGDSSAAAITQSALKDQFHLSHVVKVYVPSTVKGDIPITEEAHQKFVDQTLTQLSSWFGGATAIPGEGAWVDDKGTLIKENVTIVYAFTDKLDKAAIDQVVDYAKQLKDDLAQSAISLEVDGKLYFIE